MTQRKPFNHSERIDMKHVGRSGTIAILANNEFRVSQMQEIANTLEKKGFRTKLISPQQAMILGRMDKGEEVNFTIDQHPGDISLKDLDGAVFLHSTRPEYNLTEDQDTRLMAMDLKKAGKPVLTTGSATELIAEDSKGITDTTVGIALNGQLFIGHSDDALKTGLEAFIKGLTMTAEAA